MSNTHKTTPAPASMPPTDPEKLKLYQMGYCAGYRDALRAEAEPVYVTPEEAEEQADAEMWDYVRAVAHAQAAQTDAPADDDDDEDEDEDWDDDEDEDEDWDDDDPDDDDGDWDEDDDEGWDEDDDAALLGNRVYFGLSADWLEAYQALIAPAPSHDAPLVEPWDMYPPKSEA